ncbi:N-acetylglucosamine-6-phosphate deacetylase [Roseivivax sp. GX 12232]|uniref:N-acetylglucosamine-6-phosphate deacetylase n=1 Tax=Roseivivax sp. GX 12232 TaxID=2900547 RepID=UPI001E455043|nr:N-acetylglucosamine-6-phosphate deacetylase [Roseivivax sp. GX 12232]MCE0506476.1 N-acetylglucosamine-6-phosphate deacetylase [Roseivivax sp. GX 12232]
MTRITYLNARLFDGWDLHEPQPVSFEGGRRLPEADPGGGATADLEGDILAPGFVDLQVNGGGGVLFNHDPSAATLQTIARAHRRLGTAHLLPTLITDTPEVTRAAITAAREACAARVPGIAGLHLEGPHLSVEKCGAHDPGLIRPMTEEDLATLLAAARDLPCLKVTLAPESVTEAQVAALAEAGVYVALGHSACDAETARAYIRAGARGVTHLYNAMSQLSARAPGLTGAALAEGVWAGLIADGVHVAPEAMRVALAANPRIFLVSDAMAVAGTEAAEFTLNGRRILRAGGELRLEDGTLAGADLDLARAVSVLMRACHAPLPWALARATRLPAEAAELHVGAGRLRPGDAGRPIRLRQGPEGLALVPLPVG